MSEEEDSWSEPDVSASRKRMGISQQVLSLIEKNNKRMARAGADSSEIEEQQKQRCKLNVVLVNYCRIKLSSKRGVTMANH